MQINFEHLLKEKGYMQNNMHIAFSSFTFCILTEIFILTR